MSQSYGPDFYGLTEDQVIEAIENGTSLTAIALLVGKSKSMISKWLNADEKRSARAIVARISAAVAWDELAEHGLKSAGNAFDLAKARELAHHYRWRASKIAPKDYGERITHAGDPSAPVALNLIGSDIGG
jgi:hypothetical protein